jgi:hypothetical protein
MASSDERWPGPGEDHVSPISLLANRPLVGPPKGSGASRATGKDPAPIDGRILGQLLSLQAVPDSAPPQGPRGVAIRYRTSDLGNAENEIGDLLKDLGLKPEDALIRVFNSGLTDLVLSRGTDRAGIDTVDCRRYQPEVLQGYAKALQDKGLRLEDGLYAIPMSNLGSSGTTVAGLAGMTNTPCYRAAIEVYRKDRLDPVAQSAVDGTETCEFWAFKDPTKKLGALAGVILPEPVEADVAFAGIAKTEDRLDCIERLLKNVSPETLPIIREHLEGVKWQLAHSPPASPGPQAARQKDLDSRASKLWDQVLAAWQTLR